MLGRTIQLDSAPHTIVGVLPPNFRHPYRAEVCRCPCRAARSIRSWWPGNYLYAPARLKPGVTLEQAQRSMREMCARIAKEFPGPNNPRDANITPLHHSFVREIEPKMFAVTAAALFVLLIAGANLASLLLARQIEREAETSVRAALGASRGRLHPGVSCAKPGARQRGLHPRRPAGPVAGRPAVCTRVPWPATPPAARCAGTIHGVHLDPQVLAVSAGLTLLVGSRVRPVPRPARLARRFAARAEGQHAAARRSIRKTHRTLSLLVVITEIAVAAILLGWRPGSWSKALAT